MYFSQSIVQGKQRVAISRNYVVNFVHGLRAYVTHNRYKRNMRILSDYIPRCITRYEFEFDNDKISLSRGARCTDHHFCHRYDAPEFVRFVS